MSKILTLIILLTTSMQAFATDVVKGKIVDDNGENIVGASVFWLESKRGTTTNSEGCFEIARNANEKKLVISYIGYNTVTIDIDTAQMPLHIVMTEGIELDEVVVRNNTGMISSHSNVFQTQKITKGELFRAACCSLAESFETNPSVDVSYADAATGAKQIKLLGLAGTYVQMLTENYPNFRGASMLYGLDYIPGPWMESIQVSKGTSSVKNGYEALAGQINVEYKKPFIADYFSLNLFANDAERYEVNADGSWDVNDKLSSVLFTHFSKDTKEHDDNDDGFMDMPKKQQINLMNRWQYKTKKYISQYGVKFIHENRLGGQAASHHKFADPYKIDIATTRFEGFTKQAFIINSEKGENIALIMSGSYHDMQADYDRTAYNIYQKNIYASLMYEKNFSKMHSLSTGLNMNFDGFDENLTRQSERITYNRDETVPGAYAQYTFNFNDKFIALMGLRVDYSTKYDFFVTPRLHIKYNPFEWFNIRASVGKGFRSANALAENNTFLSSSRKIVLPDNLDKEEAWNTGLNFAFYIPLGGEDLTINAEWYYTNFINQVVVDIDSDPHAVRFYNLNGKSYSSCYQIEATYNFPFLRGFSLTGAYRYTDAKTDYCSESGKIQRLKHPLVSSYKSMLTASYHTPLKKWQFDITGQFNGSGRMPVQDTSNPLWDKDFGAYQIWNIQATKNFKHWSVYAGSENLFNFTQQNPIIDAANPRSNNFDASLVYGPIHGRKIYVGLRFNIER